MKKQTKVLLFKILMAALYLAVSRFFIRDPILWMFAAAFATIGYLSFVLKQKNLRPGKEYGSARWGTEDDIAPFRDPKPDNNILLSATESLSMASRMPNPLHNRNKNIMVIGGSGSGKTRFFVKPNLMQLHSSYVVTDPKGDLVRECGKLFQRAGYRIRVLSTKNFSQSMHYNPFAYIKKEEDILTFTNTLMKNMRGDQKGSSADPFWDKAADLWLQAVVGYIWSEAPPSEQNMGTLMEMLNACEVREDDEDYQNAVDLLFAELERKQPEHFAVLQWKKFKLAAGKTTKSILITLGANLSPLDIPAIKELVSYDELELDQLGKSKTVLFIVISDTNKTFNFLPAILYTQLFNFLCDQADNEFDGPLPVPVRCILDEFANIGQIPEFKELIATIRSRNISASIILQTKSQLKSIYKDDAETIEGNCDTRIFLGGTEKTTLKELEEALGEETIDLYNESDTRSNTNSKGVNYQKTGHKLKSVFELNTMDRDHCIVQLSGVPPFYSKKYNITKHPRYKYLLDADKKNRFDVAKFLKTERKKLNHEIDFHPDDIYMEIKMN